MELEFRVAFFSFLINFEWPIKYFPRECENECLRPQSSPQSETYPRFGRPSGYDPKDRPLIRLNQVLVLAKHGLRICGHELNYLCAGVLTLAVARLSDSENEPDWRISLVTARCPGRRAQASSCDRLH